MYMRADGKLYGGGGVDNLRADHNIRNVQCEIIIDGISGAYFRLFHYYGTVAVKAIKADTYPFKINIAGNPGFHHH